MGSVTSPRGHVISPVVPDNPNTGTEKVDDSSNGIRERERLK